MYSKVKFSMRPVKRDLELNRGFASPPNQGRLPGIRNYCGLKRNLGVRQIQKVVSTQQIPLFIIIFFCCCSSLFLTIDISKAFLSLELRLLALTSVFFCPVKGIMQPNINCFDVSGARV